MSTNLNHVFTTGGYLERVMAAARIDKTHIDLFGLVPLVDEVNPLDAPESIPAGSSKWHPNGKDSYAYGRMTKRGA